MLIFLTLSAQAEERFFEINAKKFSYTPNVITVDRGDKVTIRLISEDVTHGLYLDAYKVQTRANPGQAGSVTFVADKPGRFNFRCSVTCGEFHPFMVGYLSVRPNIRLYLFAALIIAAGLAASVAVLVRKKG